MTKELARRLEAAERALARALPEGSRVAPVEGGFLLWVTLPAPLDAQALLPEAKRAGVVYAPGELFHPDAPRQRAACASPSRHTPRRRARARHPRARRSRARGAAARTQTRARGARVQEAVHV